MGFKTRYVEEIAAQRRSNKPEVSLTEFSHALNQVTLWEKWKRNINDKGRLMFRKAGLMIGEGEYFRGLYSLTVAFLLTPRLTLYKLLALRHQNESRSSKDLINR